MLFNSLTFLIFATLFFMAWPWMRRRNSSRWIYLTAASFFFYGWWDARFLLLIIGSGLVNFCAGLAMERAPRWRKLFLWTSIVANIGTLALFKYLAFLVTSANDLIGLLGGDGRIPILSLTLPVGISFYTFQAMSYVIDIYRGQLKPTRNILHFFAYLAMFPQLVAGPIIRAAHLLPQLTTWKRITEKDRWEGLKLIAHGFFKKVVIADNLASAVNHAFNSGEVYPSSSYWWVIVSMFAFQIYCDFSGYSDIARGLARWMGYEFPENFNHPYLARSFKEFWGRWHISLSTWFQDYIYIPLGGSRGGALASQRNMWITMLLSGLWHGAAWSFLIWGALHAFYLQIERITQWPKRLGHGLLGRLVSSIMMLVLVWIAWVFFRAESLNQAVQIVTTLFDFSSFSIAGIKIPAKIALLCLLVAVLRELYLYTGCDQLIPGEGRVRAVVDPVAVAILLTACVYFHGYGHAFVYFQF